MWNRLSALHFLKEEFLRLGLLENEAEAEAREALFHTLKIDGAVFFAFLNEALTAEQEETIRAILDKRQKNMPLAYILGERFFMGRRFYVNEQVLIPRWETELLCGRAEELIREKKYESALDMCTGSGCIAITLALETQIALDGADISRDALWVAEKNAKRLGAFVRLIQSDLFNSVEKEYPLILVNPPYISEAEYEALEPQVKDYEPSLALKAGKDGLDYYRRIAQEAGAHLMSGGTLLMEIGCSQGERVAGLLEGFQNIRIIKDFSGLDRIVEANKG